MWTSLPTALLAILALTHSASASRHRRSILSDASPSPVMVFSTYTVVPMPAQTLPAPAHTLTTFSAVPMPTAAKPAVFLETFTVVPMPVESGAPPAIISNTFPASPLPVGGVATPAIISNTFAASPVPAQASARPAIISNTFVASPLPLSSKSGTTTTLSGLATPSGVSFSKFPTATGTGIPDGIFFSGYPSGTGTAGTGTGTGTSYPQATGSIISNSTLPINNSPRPVNSPTTRSVPFFTLNDPTSTSTLTLNPTVSSLTQLIPASTFVTFKATAASGIKGSSLIKPSRTPCTSGSLATPEGDSAVPYLGRRSKRQFSS
ncbi:hypothetical protein VTL71DRAFT_16495 [Oculimacula yallundae]|uniref:Uncharacterized protein n=1 Tax=Oculimacula yallundae TaxID=86028 RepID=A0ABR4CFF7_9HELO